MKNDPSLEELQYAVQYILQRPKATPLYAETLDVPVIDYWWIKKFKQNFFKDCMASTQTRVDIDQTSYRAIPIQGKIYVVRTSHRGRSVYDFTALKREHLMKDKNFNVRSPWNN